MNRLAILILSSFAATPMLAEDSRQRDAHEHGVGQLDIAMDGTQIAMELHAPGADIVGFEYAATNAQDRRAVDQAVAVLARPLDLFVLPDAAACSVVQASAELESEDEDHPEEAHDHDEQEEDGNHAADDDHAGHDDAEATEHTEFHAEYLLNCDDPEAISEIGFAYFRTFPNALELEVQIVSDRGATALEVEREDPTLDLRNLF